MTLKRIAFCACLCAGFFASHAVTKQLNVKLLTGDIVSLKFDESSAISFDEGVVKIQADPSTDFQISEIENMFFTDPLPTSVPVQKSDYLVTLDRENGTITLSGAEGKTVTLLSVNGGVVTSAQKVNSDEFSINVPSSKGVCILRVDKQSYKIIKNK